MKKRWAALLPIIIIAAILRLINLGSHPAGLTWDEAALGYNSFSILKTLRDEHGVFLPIIFKSFGDYKPGLYIYLSLPAVVTFGLSAFSVRLTSALFGILAIFGIYLLTNLLSPKQKSLLTTGHFAALSLAIMPWHIHFSRGAWETNVFTTLLIFIIYFLIKSLKGVFPLWPSVILSLTTLYLYQSAKLITPVTVLIILAFFYQNTNKKVKNIPKIDLSNIILALFLSSLLLFQNLTGNAGNRLARLSIFGYQPGVSEETIRIDDNNQTTLNLFHHQKDFSLRLVAGRFFYHFSPEILFYQGEVVAKREHIPGMGMLYLVDAIFLILGLIAINNLEVKNRSLIITLLLLFALPASLTLSEFSTVRALPMVIPLSILIGLGYHQAFKNKFIFIPLFLLAFFNFTLFYDLYFTHAQAALAHEFNFGHEEVVKTINSYGKDTRVIFSDDYGQPYIYYLFYSQYDPAVYQQKKNFTDGGVDVGRVGSLDNIEFHTFSPVEIPNTKDTLYIGSNLNIPRGTEFPESIVEYHQEVSGPDQQLIFNIIKTK